jgi:hypothetical protein
MPPVNKGRTGKRRRRTMTTRGLLPGACNSRFF